MERLWWFVTGWVSGLSKAKRKAAWDIISQVDPPLGPRIIMEALVTQDRAMAKQALDELRVPWDGNECVYEAVLRRVVSQAAAARCESVIRNLEFQKYLDAADVPGSMRDLAGKLLAAAESAEKVRQDAHE